MLGLQNLSDIIVFDSVANIKRQLLFLDFLNPLDSPELERGPLLDPNDLEAKLAHPMVHQKETELIVFFGKLLEIGAE